MLHTEYLSRGRTILILSICYFIYFFLFVSFPPFSIYSLSFYFFCWSIHSLFPHMNPNHRSFGRHLSTR